MLVNKLVGSWILWRKFFHKYEQFFSDTNILHFPLWIRSTSMTSMNNLWMKKTFTTLSGCMQTVFSTLSSFFVSVLLRSFISLEWEIDLLRLSMSVCPFLMIKIMNVDIIVATATATIVVSQPECTHTSWLAGCCCSRRQCIKIYEIKCSMTVGCVIM